MVQNSGVQSLKLSSECVLKCANRVYSMPFTAHFIVSSECAIHKLSIDGSRAFPAAASSIWKSLPENIISASTLQSFQSHLKSFLFRCSFPDILL